MTMSNNNDAEDEITHYDELNTVFYKVDAALDALNGIVAGANTFAGVGVSADGKDDLYWLIVKADKALTELYDRVRLVVDGRVSDPNDLE